MKKSNIIEFTLSEIAFLLVFVVLIIYFISIPKKEEKKIDESEILFPIPSEILFDSGKAILKENAQVELIKISNEIKDILKKETNYKDWEIRIEGPTDNRPISTYRYKSNWDLSSARAISVVRFFVNNNIFQPDELQAMGYGETKPLVTNTSPENMQKNRRVEIKLINRP
jgi:chemotaxis protein MotB